MWIETSYESKGLTGAFLLGLIGGGILASMIYSWINPNIPENSRFLFGWICLIIWAGIVIAVMMIWQYGYDNSKKLRYQKIDPERSSNGLRNIISLLVGIGGGFISLVVTLIFFFAIGDFLNLSIVWFGISVFFSIVALIIGSYVSYKWTEKLISVPVK
jgi:MFS family permease